MSPNPTLPQDPNIVADCRLMLGFAWEEGKDIGDETKKLVSIADRWLSGKGEPTISGINSDWVTPREPEPPLPGAVGVDILQVFLDLRERLSRLIYPATTQSLRATATHRRGLARYLEMPLIIKFAIVVATISMVGFIYALPKPVKPGVAQGTNAVPPVPPTNK